MTGVVDWASLAKQWIAQKEVMTMIPMTQPRMEPHFMAQPRAVAPPPPPPPPVEDEVSCDAEPSSSVVGDSGQQEDCMAIVDDDEEENEHSQGGCRSLVFFSAHAQIES